MRASLILTITTMSLVLPQEAQDVTQILDSSGDGTYPCQTPRAVAIDDCGRVFVACRDSNTVFRIDSSGEISSILNSSWAGPGTPLTLPRNLEVDRDTGTLYVSDTWGVFRIKLGHVAERIADSSPLLIGARGMALDEDDNVYVVGSVTETAVKIAPDGSMSLLLTSQGDPPNPSLRPVGIAVDRQRNVYVAGGDGFIANVFKVTPSGSVSLLMDTTGDGMTSYGTGWGLAVDSVGNVYATEFGFEVFRISASGDISIAIKHEGGDGIEHFGSTVAAVDMFDNVYVPSFGFDTQGGLLVIAPDGTVSAVDTHENDLNDVIGFFGLDVNSEGDVAVSGLLSDNVYKVLSCGVVSSRDQVSNGSGVNPSDFQQNTPAILGRIWETEIVGPTPLITLVGVSGPGASVTTTAWGELLLMTPIIEVSVETKGVHRFGLPNQCELLGLKLTAQGARISVPGGRIELLNAIDIRIGRF